MRGVRIRPARVVEADSLAAVQLDTVLTAYKGIFPPHAPAPTRKAMVEDWRAAFEDPTFEAFLAENGDAAVGTVAVRADPDRAGCGVLRRLHVIPELWDKGIGSALYDAALAALRDGSYREAELWVLQANSRARAFYERRGWSLLPGEILEWPGLDVVEVRYHLSLASQPPIDTAP